MPDMEKIIRPHLPANIAPTVTTSKCQTEAPNTVATLVQAASGGGTTTKTINSQWAHHHKKYMTKKEKEQTSGKDTGGEGVVGGQATDQPS
jgi:hypothetical protein